MSDSILLIGDDKHFLPGQGQRIAYDQSGRPVEFARHLYRASRYAFTTSFPRPEAALR